MLIAGCSVFWNVCWLFLYSPVHARIVAMETKLSAWVAPKPPMDGPGTT